MEPISGAQLAGGRIHLVEYDATWPVLFEREARRIRSALGERVHRLEHVGSTSVPGLMAKPIIDILLAVPDAGNEASYVANLANVGYVLRIREPNWFEHRLFKGPDTDINLHVFSVGCSEIERMLLFRDWLRAHTADRELYQRVKQDLAQRTWQSTQDYADAKTPIVDQIIAHAGGAPRPNTLRSVKEVVSRTDVPSPALPFSAGIKANGFVFASGQVGTDPRSGQVAGPDVASQTRQAIANLQAVLEAGGSSLDRLVKTTVFLADMRVFEAMNAVYRELIPEPRPGRSTVEARLARPELLVEIEGIGVTD